LLRLRKARKGFPGVGQVRGGGAAGALASSTGRWSCAVEGGSRFSGVRLIITPGKFA